MIEIKNIVGVDLEITYDNTSEVIPNGTLINIETLNYCNSKQGIAKVIALILTDNFEIYKDSVKKDHNLMNTYYHNKFNV